MFQETAVSEVLNGKYPEWIVFVITRAPDGRVDLMPAGWCMVCSAKPPMLAVALGRGRYTRELILETGEFNVGFAGEGQLDVIDFTGSRSGRQVDKLEALGLTMAPPKVNTVPLLEGCSRVFECRLCAHLEAGDHTIVTGEIVAAHLSDPPVKNLVNFGGRYCPAMPEE